MVTPSGTEGLKSKCFKRETISKVTATSACAVLSCFIGTFLFLPDKVFVKTVLGARKGR